MESLNDNQLRAIYLLTHTNMKKKEVAEEVGIEASSLSRWFRNDNFKKAYDEAMHDAFKEYANDAQQVILDIMMKGEKENNRLAAAKDVLSRAGYDATSKVEQTSETTIKVSVNDTD